MNVKAYYQTRLYAFRLAQQQKKTNWKWKVTLEESLEGGDTDISINYSIRKERVFLPSIKIASFGTRWQFEIAPPTVCLVPPHIVKSVACLDRSKDSTRTKLACFASQLHFCYWRQNGWRAQYSAATFLLCTLYSAQERPLAYKNSKKYFVYTYVRDFNISVSVQVMP